ncbi:MAG: polyprenol monophosphomannose synthase [Candidatus Woykebacteria bacterium]
MKRQNTPQGICGQKTVGIFFQKVFDKKFTPEYYPLVLVSIVIPTYKERGNIGPLISQILDLFEKTPHKLRIIVVDDSSPDGTALVVKKTIGQLGNRGKSKVQLLVGKKEGLGAAYIRGFEFTLNKLKPDVIIQMDADFSHDPLELPKLLAEIEKGSDFVIGSRYVRGGKVPKNWNIFRKINSRWGNRFARYLAGIDDVADCTSGFRAIKREILERIDLNKLKVRGYSFQMNLLYKAYVTGAKIKEVPINFKERVWGHTKLGPSDIAEFMWNSLKLRFEQGFGGIDKKALRASSKREVLEETGATST